MPTASPPLNKIADLIGCHSSSLIQLRDRHNLSEETLRDPDALFGELLIRGYSGKIRKALVDPANRQRIRQEIDLLAIRGNVPPTLETKTASIQ